MSPRRKTEPPTRKSSRSAQPGRSGLIAKAKTKKQSAKEKTALDNRFHRTSFDLAAGGFRCERQRGGVVAATNEPRRERDATTLTPLWDGSAEALQRRADPKPPVSYSQKLASVVQELVMPRRTNDFQTLIRHIYEQLKPVGATVTESAMLKERGSNVEREIDVLLEAPIADSVVRLAIECRDRGRLDDIGWIDSLIGKYRDLPVDKIVAVSRGGVTRAAAEKAAANRIDVRTLEAAIGSEWPSELLKLGYARVQVHVTPVAYLVFTEPEWPDNEAPTSVEVNGVAMTADQFIRLVARGTHDEIASAIGEQRDGLFRTIEDLDRTYDTDFDLEIQNTALVAHEKTRHCLERLVLRCAVSLSFEEIPVERHLLGEIGVSVVGENPDAPGERLLVVQRPGEEPVRTSFSVRENPR